MARLLRPGREADDDVDAAVLEVLGVGVALAAVADDGDGLAGQRRRVGVVVVVHARGHRRLSSPMRHVVPSSLGQGRHGAGSQDGFDVDDARAAGHGDGAGAHHLPDAEAAQQRDEGVDLLLGAAVLDDDGLRADVEDAALVELDDAQDLGPVVTRWRGP